MGELDGGRACLLYVIKRIQRDAICRTTNVRWRTDAKAPALSSHPNESRCEMTHRRGGRPGSKFRGTELEIASRSTTSSDFPRDRNGTRRSLDPAARRTRCRCHPESSCPHAAQDAAVFAGTGGRFWRRVLDDDGRARVCQVSAGQAPQQHRGRLVGDSGFVGRGRLFARHPAHPPLQSTPSDADRQRHPGILVGLVDRAKDVRRRLRAVRSGELRLPHKRAS